jgi:hypothetical protein
VPEDPVQEFERRRWVPRRHLSSRTAMSYTYL